MKKTFDLNSPNHSRSNHLDSIRYEIKKYIARERKKPLPKGADFWGFNCRIGHDQESSVDIHVAEISKKLGTLASENKESLYLEILAKPEKRTKKADYN